MNYFTLGPTPGEEECAQVNKDDYSERSRKESKAYIAQLVRMHGEPPVGARYSMKGFPHDFGQYHEVVIYYDDTQEALTYAKLVDENTPGEWDSIARRELEIPIVKNAKTCELCEGEVDRFENRFQCRGCGAFGNLNTGIMTDCTR